MPIKILSPDVANKIAAGEVIERPVSVAKELLENAIDAGADDVRVEIEGGGKRLVRVGDNGSGIGSAEVELAFARHATSKLTSADELFRIRTLGFRGEALSSIAAVSRLTLSTRSADEEAGTRLRIEGGQVVSREGTGRPPGTLMQVENLFYNTPARLKFLRTDNTEAGHIARLVTSYALAYPEKRFSLQNKGRLVLRTTGTGKLFDVILALYGLDIAEQTLPVGEPDGGEGLRIHVWGYVGAPAVQRSNRRDILFFVNRRWVQNNSLVYAVSEAYRTLQPQRRYPLAVLNITLPPDEVDVNIHPTKREVRFRHERDVFGALHKAVRTTVMARRPVPVVDSSADSVAAWGRPRAVDRASLPTSEQARMGLDLWPGDAAPVGDAPLGPSLTTSVAPRERLPMLRVLGQVGQTYIIAEGPGGMYLIDQHAAHERIRYEQLVAQRRAAAVASQELLDPLPVELAPSQATLLEGNFAALSGFGFEIIPFGGTTFLVKRVPASLVGEDIPGAILEMIDAAIEGGEGFSWEDQALITLSCHTAIRAGQTMALDEMRDLIRQLERATLPHTCPHGRPTIIHLSQAQLEKEFGRR